MIIPSSIANYSEVESAPLQSPQVLRPHELERENASVAHHLEPGEPDRSRARRRRDERTDRDGGAGQEWHSAGRGLRNVSLPGGFGAAVCEGRTRPTSFPGGFGAAVCEGRTRPTKSFPGGSFWAAVAVCEVCESDCPIFSPRLNTFFSPEHSRSGRGVRYLSLFHTASTISALPTTVK